MKRLWQLLIFIVGLALLLWLLMAGSQKKPRQNVAESRPTKTVPLPRIYMQ